MEIDVENRIMDTEQEGEGGANGESGMETQTPLLYTGPPVRTRSQTHSFL